MYFPGIKEPAETVYGPFSEQGHLYGVPISIGGRGKVVPVHIQDGEVVHCCEATRDVALLIAPHLFHHKLRVHGIGRYVRDEKGQWETRSFRISEFEKLDMRPLGETVERLRSITRRSGLDRDILARLTTLRGDEQ